MKPWIKMVISLILGIGVGILSSTLSWMLPYQQPIAHYLTLAGKIFIDLLKMLVGILVFSSLVTGICHIQDPKKLGRIGMRSFAFFFFSTVVAISIGIAVATWIRPGAGLHLKTNSMAVQEMNIMEFILAIIPSNPIAAFAQGNILQIIVFGIMLSLAIIMAKEKGKILLEWIESLNEVMCRLTQMVMKLAPYGVFALIASAVTSIGWKVVIPLLSVVMCNYLSCFILICVVFGAVLHYGAGIKLSVFFKGMKDAILLAFTTCSSAATLPSSLECLRKNLGVSKEISGFVMSLGITFNMNGAAIGQAVSALFIAQAYHIEITWLKIGILMATALMSAIGAAGIPGTGLVMLSVVLNAMGLPLEGIALVAGVDRLREMMSTMTNILGDAVATVYVAKKEAEFEKRELFVT